MTEDDANDRREGYADGMAGRPEPRSDCSSAYFSGFVDGAIDRYIARTAAPRPLSIWWRIYARIARVFV